MTTTIKARPFVDTECTMHLHKVPYNCTYCQFLSPSLLPLHPRAVAQTSHSNRDLSTLLTWICHLRMPRPPQDSRLHSSLPCRGSGVLGIPSHPTLPPPPPHMDRRILRELCVCNKIICVASHNSTIIFMAVILFARAHAQTNLSPL